MARKYFVQDYYTETIEDFMPEQWLAYGIAKLGDHGRDVKLVGVRNWLLERDEDGIRSNNPWQRPVAFSHGKRCKDNTQKAMKDGFVELRFSYTPYESSAYRI